MTYHASYVIHHMSPITCHISYIIYHCHVLYIIDRISYIISYHMLECCRRYSRDYPFTKILISGYVLVGSIIIFSDN